MMYVTCRMLYTYLIVSISGGTKSMSMSSRAGDSAMQSIASTSPPKVQIALEFTGVSRSFPGVRALDDVNLRVRCGEVHAVVGENGAGKSTLMAIASGALAADDGVVAINGEILSDASPAEARGLGIAICRQKPSLMGDLTVAENLALAFPPGARTGWASINTWAAENLNVWSSVRTIEPTDFARNLDPASSFMVEIVKAVSQNPTVLLLDEPTEALGMDECEILFRMIQTLAAAGTAIVYISHRIPDVLRISDRVSVLRDGQMRWTRDAADVDQEMIVEAIVGAPLDVAFPPKRVEEAVKRPVMTVSAIDSNFFHGIDFVLNRGEIVGISGVDGNGQSQVIRALAGLESFRGTVEIDGKARKIRNAAHARKAGLAYLPASRHSEGIWADLGVRENITTPVLSKLSKAGFISSRKENEVAARQIKEFSIKTANADTRIGTLSGGNQQKAVIARAVETDPRVILAHEPTQGVDVGSRLEIYRRLREQAERGAVLVVSSDAAELEGLCDRVLVMSSGRVVTELVGEDVSEQKMTGAALNATHEDKKSSVGEREPWWKRFVSSDHAPPAGLLLAIIALTVYSAQLNDKFLTELNIAGLLTLFAVLAFAALAQQTIMITGGIDLSVGPAMGFLVILGSFWLIPGSGPLGLLLGIFGLLLCAAFIGIANWLPTVVGVPMFLATLVTYTALQGLAFLIRPTPGGAFDESLLEALGKATGWVPWAAAVAAIVTVIMEVVLRKTRFGAALRAVGSNATAAHEAGLKVHWIRLGAGLVSACLIVAAALLLMAQVGAGDATVGANFTLLAITAAVVGGASIFGGRGSMLGAVLGALLVQLINTVTVFLGLDTAWQSYLLGGITLIAAGFYSLARGRNSHAR
ncbi:ATP-binding cassette domain-containing protein [Rhodococcus erythropolis]